MPRLQSLGDNVYLLKGSPNTGIVLDKEVERMVIIDPGIGEGRGHSLTQIAVNNGFKEAVVILTHGHTDHLAAAAELERLNPPIYAPRHCTPLVESSIIRRVIVYGGLVSAKIASMPMIELRVDYEYEDQHPLPGGLQAVSLPGHSPGHSGVLSDAGIIFAGDSILGEKVIERFGIPFGINLREMLNSIKKLEEYVEKGYTLVPGHGPIVSGERAIQLLEANAKAILKAKEKLLDLLSEKDYRLEEATGRLTEILAKTELTPRQLLLNRTAVQSLLSWLEEEGLVKPVVAGGEVYWRRLKS